MMALFASLLLGPESLHMVILSVLAVLFVACGGLLGLIGMNQFGEFRRWELSAGVEESQTSDDSTASEAAGDAQLDRQVRMYLQRTHHQSLRNVGEQSLTIAAAGESFATSARRREPPRRAA